MIHFSVRAAAAVLCLFFSSAGAAQTRYILETQPGIDPSPLAAKYVLSVGKSWQDRQHTAYAVTAAAPLSAAALKAVRSEKGVIEFESDAELPGTEAEPASRATAALETLGEQLALKGTVTYYRSQVRASYVTQPATRIIGLFDALLRFGAGTSIVAIIDTGVDPNHPALRDVLLPGYDFTRDLAGTANELADLDQSTVAILDQSTVAILDKKQTPVRLNQSTVAILDQSTVAILDGTKLPKAFGHGTMVAGLVHLVAPQARILPLKAFRADGSASLSHIVRAIYHAADHGATIVSMSFSMDSPSTELKQAIAYATGKGVICVASAGNEGLDKRVYPAAFQKVIGVGSTNYADHRSLFSNYGGSVVTSAPGEAVITTYPGNNYAGVWGTSFSTAQVAGAAALMRQVNSRAKYDTIKDALDHGRKLSQDMGDARLALVASILYCLFSY